MAGEQKELLTPEQQARLDEAAGLSGLARFKVLQAAKAEKAKVAAEAAQAITEPVEPVAQAAAEPVEPVALREPTPAPISASRATEPIKGKGRRRLEKNLDATYAHMLHIGDPSKGEDSTKVYIGDKTSDDFVSTFQGSAQPIVDDWIISRYLRSKPTRSAEVVVNPETEPTPAPIPAPRAAGPLTSAGAARAQVSGKIETGPARPAPRVEPDEPKVIIEAEPPAPAVPDAAASAAVAAAEQAVRDAQDEARRVHGELTALERELAEARSRSVDEAAALKQEVKQARQQVALAEQQAQARAQEAEHLRTQAETAAVDARRRADEAERLRREEDRRREAAERARRDAEARVAAAARAGRPPAGLPAQAGGLPRPIPPHERARIKLEAKQAVIDALKELQKVEEEVRVAEKEFNRLDKGVKGLVYKAFFLVKVYKAKDRLADLTDPDGPLDQGRKKYDAALRAYAKLDKKITDDVERELKGDLRQGNVQERGWETKAEIEAAAPGRRAAETQERRPGLTPDAPARTPGEGDQEYLTRWQRVKDAAVSGVKFFPKMVWGVASTLLGVRAAEATFRFFAERGRLKKEKKAFGALVEEMRSIVDREAAAGTPAEQERLAEEGFVKVGALVERIKSLKQDGYLKDEDAQRMLDKITEVINRRREAEQNAQAARNQEVEQILKDYFQRRASGLELGKQYSNLGLLLSGWQFGRAVTYGGLSVLQRAIRARGEQESTLNLTAEQRKKSWETAREMGVLKDITVNASKEFGKGLTGVVWDIFKNKQTRRGDFARLKMGTRKAVGTAALMAGFATLVYAEATEIGPQDQIESVLQKMEKNGMAQTLGHNYLHNLDQLSFGLFRLGEDGELKVADNPDEGVAKPAAAAEVPKAPEAAAVPEITKTPDEVAYESALARLEKSSGGKIDFDPETGRVEIMLGEGGYEHIQHALRDLAVLEKMLTDKSFTTLDAAHVENVVANLKYLLEGKDLRFMEAEQLDGIAHLGAGKLIIHDIAKFHEVMQGELLAHATDKITAGNLGRYDEMVATINNTSDSNWQADVDVATGVSAAGEQGYVEVEIDHQAVHQAEIEVARHAVEDLGIEGASVSDTSILDEDSYTIDVAGTSDAVFGGYSIKVDDGYVDEILTSAGRTIWTHDLDEPIDIDHPYAGNDLARALEDAKAEVEATLARSGAGAEGAGTADITPVPVAGEADFSELIKTPVAEGGLVGPDGYVHFGDVQFKTEWLDKIDERGVTEFSNDPIEVAKIPWYMRLGNEALTLRALAETMKNHPDTGTVGDYIVKHQEELAGWMRETPPTPGPGEGIPSI